MSIVERLTNVTTPRVIGAIVAAIAAVPASFIATMWLYMVTIGAGDTIGLGGVVLGLIIAPFAAVGAALGVLCYGENDRDQAG